MEPKPRGSRSAFARKHEVRCPQNKNRGTTKLVTGTVRSNAAAGAMSAMMFLSGLGALVFEVVWFNQIGLIVGNSVWSAALVVGAFMAGLALGNGLAVPLARRWSNLVRGYCAVETVAALSGAAVVLAIPFLPALFRPLLALLLDHAAALNAMRIAIAFVLMVVPATALGASLPLLSKPLEQASGNYGFALGRLYGMNTLGAVAGTLLAEFALVPWIGLRASGLFAAACNLCAAGIAWHFARGSMFGPAAAAPPRSHTPVSFQQKRILAAAFLSGGVLLALEVVWFRFLLLLHTGTTIMFAIMLGVVLAGLGLGGIAASAWSRAGWHPGAAARIAAAGAAIALVVGYGTFHLFHSRLGVNLPHDSVTQIALLSIFLMGPVCVFSGVLFTALGSELRARATDAPTTTGVLTLANTVGALAGSLLAAFALLPWLGLEASFFVLTVAYGVVVLTVPGAGKPWRWSLAPAAVAAAAVVAFPFGTMRSIYYPATEKRFGGRVLEVREGLVQTAFYLVHEFLGEPREYQLVTNSYSMSGTASHGLRYMKLFAYLPAAFHPRIERALVICFGVGVTAGAVADLPDVKAIDIVDVSRDILEMSDIVYPDARQHPLRDSRASVRIEDGRFFLQQTGQRYDLITGEPPPPKMAGVVWLYTREYFDLIRERLNPGGMVTYWLSTNELRAADALAIIRAFCEVFEDCSLWHGISSQWILLGSRDGARPASAEAFSRLWRLPRTRNELYGIGLETPEHMVAQFMADAAQLKRLTGAAAPLVDDFPRRLSPVNRAERFEALFGWLVHADRSRERLDASAWLSAVVPKELVVASVPRFRERAMLDEEFFPYLQRPDHSYWENVAQLLRQPDLFTWKTWMLGSDPRTVDIARSKNPADPLAAEQLAIDALATGRKPERTMMVQERFMAMTPKGQVLTILRHCLADEQARARSLMAWIPEKGRAEEPYRRFLAWAARGC
jgi:spermidine synthase